MLPVKSHALSSVEVCAGAGGQALGLEMGGFGIWRASRSTRRPARPCGSTGLAGRVERDLRALVASLELEQLRGCDLLAGGVPCPPFSMAGKQLGGDDERDLFPAILDLAAQLRPRALLIENVRGLLSQRFAAYRENVVARLRWMGYPVAGWELLQAADFGVPQLRPRAVLVAFREGRPVLRLVVARRGRSRPRDGGRCARRSHGLGRLAIRGRLGGARRQGSPDSRRWLEETRWPGSRSHPGETRVGGAWVQRHGCRR